MGKMDVGINEHGGPPWWVFDYYNTSLYSLDLILVQIHTIIKRPRSYNATGSLIH